MDNLCNKENKQLVGNINLRHLRCLLQHKLYSLTGWWVSKKHATKLVLLLKYLDFDLLNRLDAQVQSGKIKAGQHTNYYKTILYRWMQDELKKQKEPSIEIKSMIDKILCNKNI